MTKRNPSLSLVTAFVSEAARELLGVGELPQELLLKARLVLLSCVGIGVHLSMTNVYIQAEPRVCAWEPQTRELFFFSFISLR